MTQGEFSPEIVLDHTDRGQLAATTASAGYRIMHRIFRAEVDKFIIDVINADPAFPERVVSKHLLAKAAAQFYDAITNRINEEILQYAHAMRGNEKPIDPTENSLDIGDSPRSLEDFDHLGEEDEIF